jgi:hypothetical protein
VRASPWVASSAAVRMESLLKKPEKGGIPARASRPTVIVQ